MNSKYLQELEAIILEVYQLKVEMDLLVKKANELNKEIERYTTVAIAYLQELGMDSYSLGDDCTLDVSGNLHIKKEEN